MPKWTKEQEEAIQKDGSNIIVSAGAGSGKTAVLSERVIYKLEHGVHVNELLILTFTKAAAEEMKDRIRKKIKKNPELKEELKKLDSAYITTFDSFALSVVKKYHYLLNIPKDIGIADDSIVKIQKKKFIDETFEEYYLKNDTNFAKLVQTFCIKNDNTLRTMIAKLADKIENYIDADIFINEIKNKFFEKENIDKIIDEYKELIKEKKKEVSLELDNTSHYFDTDFIIKLQTVLLPLLNTDNLTDFSAFTKITLPTVPKGTEEEAKQVKANLKKAVDNLLSYTQFGNEETITESIMSTKNMIQIIIEMIESYNQKLKDYKLANNIYTFGDIASYAIKILNNFESARLELKNSFKEIMIDEYQDTNDVQETFIGLIADNNVYMVGDIKQSIYRFRGSNPNIFKEKYDNYSKNIGGYKIDLIKNFRSRSEVLDNINRIFDLIMDNELGGAEYYESHEMVYGNSAYSDELLPDYDYNFKVLEYQNSKETDYSDDEIEIFTIANDIKKKMNSHLQVFDKEKSKLRPATYSDFVIILDRSKYFDEFKQIFEYLDIPLTILKDGKLNSSPDILIIKNIVDFIIRIKKGDFGIDFKYDFMSIGRSFLYEYDDNYLFDIITNNKFKETTLYKDFSNINNYYSKTSNELFGEILEVTNFYNKLNKVGDYENINVRIQKLSELSSNLNNIGLSIEDFRDYLNEIVENDYEIKYTQFQGASDSVKILTIHKSKGLEYPVCYFADLNHDFNTKELKDKFICDRTYGIISPSDNENLDDSVIKVLYKNMFMKEEISEKIRLFYVALTRAREEMIMVLPSKDTIKLEKNNNGTIEKIRRLKFTKLSDFLYSVKDYLPDYFYEINANEIGLTKNYLFGKPLNELKDNNTSLELIVEEVSIPYEKQKEAHFSKSLPELVSKESKTNMEFGTLVHEVLELTDFKNYNPELIKIDFIRDKVSKFVQNDLLKNVKDAEIYREYEFTYQKDKTNYHGIIDLMLEYPDRIDIIDYKLKNTTDEHYLDQLKGYKEYIMSLSNKPIKMYLYSIINESITEL